MRHFQYYYNPQHQRWIVRILIMVPIYSICSSLSFRFFYHSIYFDIIRDCYEAFVIFSFFENQHKFMQTIHAPSRMRYPFPLNCFTFNPRGNAFLVNTKMCILQYVVVRPIMTIAAYFMEWYGILCPVSMDPRYGSVWVSSINLISVSVAMYALILFYIVIHHEIPERKPLWKFIAVKFVVFFSFWQSIVIGILDTAGVIQGTSAWSSGNTSSLIEAFLISFEMIIASFIHIKAFNYKEYIPQHPTNTDSNNISAIPRTQIWAGFWDAINMVDILKDIVGVSSEVKAVRRKRRERRAQRALESRSGSLMDLEMDESEVEVVSVAEVKMGSGDVVVQSVGRRAEIHDSNAFVISGERISVEKRRDVFF
ncbi:organic solute transporter Ostalpha-domain-containing protein [Chytriomyces cf. hyalinus JEL632]|nr:organic solute transporter Ostalpha-domain-containing protein [Chytriomyces cf. hyalinus JEL632]